MLSKALSLAAAGNAAPAGYQIERSLRFNAADTTYLQRTLGTPTSRTTMTFSFWTKKWSIGKINSCWNNYVGSLAYGQIVFQSGEKLEIYSRNSGGTVTVNLQTTALYRDPSAWYHVVIAVDTTQATSSDRVKAYINGVRITAFNTATYPSQNSDVEFQVASRIAAIGRRADGGDSSQNLSAYLADYFLIDGQALTPSDFGEFDTTTGVWKPKEYTGTYGTNGFHLPFSDNTSTTTLGYDTSGNSNNWTLNNFSVATGAGNDSLVDTPTPYGTDTGVGGEVRGNHCTLNPLAFNYSGGTYNNGNLEYYGPSAWRAVGSTILLPSTGKWYAEVSLINNSANNTFASVYNGFGLIAPNALFGWAYNSATSFYVTDTGHYSNYSSGSSGSFTQPVANTVIALAVDRDANTVTIYRDNVAVASNVTLGITAGSDLLFFRASYNGSYGNMIHNFGQRPFAYTAPSGFKALCTQNLPDPTVVQGDDYFNTVLYTGNGTTNAITGVGFQPDFTWIKERNGAVTYHAWFDAIRGVTKALYSNDTLAETTGTAFTSFDSDGFTLSLDISQARANDNTDTYVAWNWNAGGSNATNTDGTITSTVRANTTAGFSIVSYTGVGSTGTVGHGLGSAPAMIIARPRPKTNNWLVYHQTQGAGNFLELNTTSAVQASTTPWNNTAPTSTVFSVNTPSGVWLNESGTTYIAYCFAEVEGFSKFGSYTANGSTDGPFIYCGFRPAFIICKRTSTSGQWGLLDDKRPGYNVTQKILFPNGADAEVDSSTYAVDFTSNGFKIRNSGAEFNQTSGQTYIFIAFAENPFKYSIAR